MRVSDNRGLSLGDIIIGMSVMMVGMLGLATMINNLTRATKSTAQSNRITELQAILKGSLADRKFCTQRLLAAAGAPLTLDTTVPVGSTVASAGQIRDFSGDVMVEAGKPTRGTPPLNVATIELKKVLDKGNGEYKMNLEVTYLKEAAGQAAAVGGSTLMKYFELYVQMKENAAAGSFSTSQMLACSSVDGTLGDGIRSSDKTVLADQPRRPEPASDVGDYNDNAFSVGCPPNYLATGIKASCGSNMDGYSLRCSSVSGDTPDTPMFLSTRYGRKGNDMDETCPAGTAIAEIRGRVDGGNIRRIEFLCRRIQDYSIVGWKGTCGSNPDGTAFDMNCNQDPAGLDTFATSQKEYFVTQLSGRASEDHLNRFGAVCNPLSQ
jgi:hypothetical protein